MAAYLDSAWILEQLETGNRKPETGNWELETGN
jgi:hypothetical protein